jgi:hypothetical protein
MAQNIIAFFSDNGTPKTGLAPVIRIRNVSTTAVLVAGDAMSEVGDGWYKYDFTEYTGSIDYAMRCDGDPTGLILSGSDRYMFAGNDNYVDDIWGAKLTDHNVSGSIGSAVNFMNDVQGGRWQVVSNQMVFFKSDNVTEVARFNLFDENGNPTTVNPFERRRT